jgi:hypothetical protein
LGNVSEGNKRRDITRLNPTSFATEPSEFSLEDPLPSGSLLQEGWLSRTVWLALFCLLGLAPAIAIRLAGPPTSLAVAPAPDRSQAEAAFGPNRAAKSDRLALPSIRAASFAAPETLTAVPAAEPMPAPIVPSGPETVRKAADRHWQDANASINPAAPPRRPAKARESKPSADQSPPGKRAEKRVEIWHCRQDAVGGLLRSLDLTPKCQL